MTNVFTQVCVPQTWSEQKTELYLQNRFSLFALLEVCRHRCSKGVDSIARRLSILLLERCRQHCSNTVDTCTLSLCRARQVKSDFSYIFQKSCSPRISRPYHNLHLAFGDVFGDAGDNLRGLVDGEAVIVFRDEICARSAPNAGRWSLVAGRWSLVAGRWSLVAGRWSLVAGRWSLVAGRWSRKIVGAGLCVSSGFACFL